MHKSSSENVCKNDVKIIKNDLEIDAKIVQKASKGRPRRPKGSQEAAKRRQARFTRVL